LSYRVLHGGLEGAVAIAQEDGDIVRPNVGDGQIEIAVTVEIPRHQDTHWITIISDVGGRGADRVEPWGLEAAVTVAQQHGDITRASVCDHQVELAIAVEVAADHTDEDGVGSG
jgi:hypothetical protein